MNPTRTTLTQVTLEEQRRMLPNCALPSCSIESFTYIEQVFVTGQSFKVHLCVGHMMQHRVKTDS